jgi:hypothetical protein
VPPCEPVDRLRSRGAHASPPVRAR